MRFRPAEEHWTGVPFKPRAWQHEALPGVLEAIQTPDNRPIVRAVTGAGKSYFLSEVSRCCVPSKGERVVITTPTVKLVEQLHETLSLHLGRGKVGRFYTKAKDTRTPYIVCCIPSAKALAQKLHEEGFSVALWIADECHRTETTSMLEASEAMNPARAIGFTATPFRSEPGEALSLWDEVVCDYGPSQAIRDGVVVPWELRFWSGEDDDIDEVCATMILQAVGEGLGAGVVNAITIHDAEMFSDQLNSLGVRSAPIHSKLHDRDQSRLIKQLKGGLLDCLVHVSLLQEGVDFPWLRWLCLRRPVQSRVRFIQEVGRVLRSDKGKDRAIIYDPHDLFAMFRLDYNAVLSGDVSEEDDIPVEASLKEVSVYIDELFSAPLQRLETRPRFMSSVSAYLRRLVVAFDAAGRVKRSTSKPWRQDGPTRKQLNAIWKLKFVLKTNHCDQIPDPHRIALAVAVERREELSKGEANDLMSVLKSLQSDPSWPSLCDVMARPVDL